MTIEAEVFEKTDFVREFKKNFRLTQLCMNLVGIWPSRSERRSSLFFRYCLIFTVYFSGIILILVGLIDVYCLRKNINAMAEVMIVIFFTFGGMMKFYYLLCYFTDFKVNIKYPFLKVIFFFSKIYKYINFL